MSAPTTRDASLLLDILGGLVPLHLVRLRDPAELDRVRREITAEAFGAGSPSENPQEYGLADTIAACGDRLTNPNSFRSKADRADRSRLLNAMATALALSAMSPGGVTWCGRHWCTGHAACLAAGAA